MAFGNKPKKEKSVWTCACRQQPSYILYCPVCGRGAPTKPKEKP